MKKITKILAVIMLCCVMATTFGITAFAQDDYGVMPCYDNVSTADVDITYSGTTGTVSGSATKVTGVTRLEGTLVLYKKNSSGGWDYVDTWTGSTTRRTLSITGNFTAPAGATFKAEFTVTAYGDTTETITIEYEKTNN